MNTAVINVKTEPKVKEEAQEVASMLGVNLNSLINRYLKHFIKTKSVNL